MTKCVWDDFTASIHLAANMNKLGTKTLTKRDSEVSWGHTSLGNRDSKVSWGHTSLRNRDRLGTKIGTPERHKDTIDAYTVGQGQASHTVVRSHVIVVTRMP